MKKATYIVSLIAGTFVLLLVGLLAYANRSDKKQEKTDSMKAQREARELKKKALQVASDHGIEIDTYGKNAKQIAAEVQAALDEIENAKLEEDGEQERINGVPSESE